MLLPGAWIPPDSRVAYHLWESGHLFLFLIGWHLLYTAFPSLSRLAFARQLVILLGVTLAGILVLEGLQGLFAGKPPATGDVLGDLAGALLYLCFRQRGQIRRYLALHGVALLLSGVVLWPFFRSLADELTARLQFPLLADFETPFESSRFEGKSAGVERSDARAFRGRHSLRLSLFSGPWSGTTLRHFPADWSGLSSLHFAVYNPAPRPVFLELTIRDAPFEQGGRAYHDLFSRRLLLPAQGWTRVLVPLDEVRQGPQSRELDLSRVTGLGFFVVKEEEPVTLYLDAIRLE